MSVKVRKFKPAERAKEKQAARQADEEALAQGLVSPEELRRRNGFFSSLDLRRAWVEIRPPRRRARKDVNLLNSR